MAQAPTSSRQHEGSGAADFDRPLLLKPHEDRIGWLLGRAGRLLLLAITASSVVAVLLIFVFIFREAAGFFFEAGSVSSAAAHLWRLVTDTHWYPEGNPPEFGAAAILLGSIYVSLVALVVAVPVGLLAAMGLSDILPFSVKQIVKPLVEVLAAIPSVAYGFFAILVLAPWMQDHLHLSTGTNVLNAALILAVMAVPTIVSVSEDALTAAGRELREASYACGATRAETLLRVVVPAAHSGIIAAVILGMMRAIGETMVVWMASGNAVHIPAPWWDLTQSVRTITATIAGEMGETPVGSDHYSSLFTLGLLLLGFTFALNLATEHFLRRIRRAGGAA
jgi:phosphate transport system permease protein